VFVKQLSVYIGAKKFVKSVCHYMYFLFIFCNKVVQPISKTNKSNPID